MKNTFYPIVILGLALMSFVLITPSFNTKKPQAIQPYLNHIFPTKSPSINNWKVEEVFPNLTFTDPIAMVEIPKHDYYYVGGKQGLIWLVEKNEQATKKTVALDIQDNTITSNDAGLINFILHPEFAVEGSKNQGYIFINYPFHPTIDDGNDPRMNRLSRFRTFPGSLKIDPKSEYILIQEFDPKGYHMGGGMFFDKEGYFYLTTGDGGRMKDGYNSSQQIDRRLWGGLLRIDVDNDPTRSHPIRRQPIEYRNKPKNFPENFTRGYMIPNDNPWQSPKGDILEEFFALGFRSPHRASFDAEDEKIWVADVGETLIEEISIISAGSNAQWPFLEGTLAGPKKKPKQVIGKEVAPVYEYGRAEGNSVIGGFVYRGSKWKSYLEGTYIFGDHGTRNIFSFNPDLNEAEFLTTIPEFGEGDKSGISSFATNEDGEIFILKLFGQNKDGGKIYKLVREEKVNNIPALLSETNAFTDLKNLVPAKGIIPYGVQSPLWSDGAHKKRWMALPNDGKHDTAAEQIQFSENTEWTFPSGTVFIKHFELPIDSSNPTKTKKIETRFFIIDDDGTGYGLTYQWNDEGTDAVLLKKDASKTFAIKDELGTMQEQEWQYPSRINCMTCHNANAGYVLGVKTWQLNGDFQYSSTETANQLAVWNHLGFFDKTLDEKQIKTMPKAIPISNKGNLETMVSSYLDSNCSSCHRPNGVEGAFDARFSTPMKFKNLVNAFGISHNTMPGDLLIQAGHPTQSQLWIRDNSVADGKMPPLAKSTVDTAYMSVLTQWIEGLEADCNGVYLSDMKWASTPKNGLGKVHKGHSILKKKSEEHYPMSIANEIFNKGLNVLAPSEISYRLEKQYAQFNASIGVDDAACKKATIQFEVYADQQLKYQSPMMKKGQQTEVITVNVQDVQVLTLVTRSSSKKTKCQVGNWADAKLLRFLDGDLDGICD